MSGRALEAGERRTLAVLGLPTAAMALAITIVTTYVPVVARDFLASTTIIGGLIAIEGALALWLPLVVGSWSDRLQTPVGGRLPFLIAATPVAVVALALLGLVRSTAMLAIVVTVFFAAYFVAYEPYRAIYPDVIDDEIAARAQSTQAVWRGAGTGLALVGGGVLVSLGSAVPFAAGAAVFVVAMAVFLRVAMPRARARETYTREGAGTIAAELRGVRDLVRENPALRSYLAANALWEASLGALKTFVFLFVTVGLGKSQPEAAGIIGAIALLVLPAALISGRLADRYGRLRMMSLALPLYGLGLLVPAFTTWPPAMAPFVLVMGFGGGLIMALPYAVLQPLMPEGRHGALTGFYSLSRGIGTALGPLLAGIAIGVLKGPFHSTDGYAAMWLVCGATVLASVPFLRALRRRAGDVIDPQAPAAESAGA